MRWERLVFATGFKQDDGAPCTQLQIPFIRAYGYDGPMGGGANGVSVAASSG